MERWRTLILAVWSVALCTLLALAAGVSIDTSADLFLDRASEPYAFYQWSAETFGGDETQVVLLPVPEGDRAGALRVAGELAAAMEQIPEFRRVDSIHSFPAVRVTTDGALDLSAPADSAVDADGAFALAMSDRIYPRVFVSEGGDELAVVGLVAHGTSDFEALVDTVQTLSDERGGIVSGVPRFRIEANRRTHSDLLKFVPLTVAVVFLVTWVLFQSAKAALYAMVPGATGTLAVAGLAAAMGVSLNLVTVTLPALMLALGAAYAMHLLAPAAGTPGFATAKRIRQPTLLSGATTTFAFLSIATNDIEAVYQLGVLGAVGVVTATLATVTLLPALLERAPLVLAPGGRLERIRSRMRGVSGTLARASASRRALVAWLALVTPLAGAISWLEVRTDVIAWFDEDSAPRRDYRAVRDRLSGISPVNIVVSPHDPEDPKGAARVTEPEVLAAIDGLAHYLDGLPAVGKVVSVADPLRQVHGGFSGDPSQPLPRERALIEQYLLLLDGTHEIRDVITLDRRHANIQLHVDDNGSDALRRVAEDAERWWRENGAPTFTARSTGIMFEFARAEDAIALGMMRGLAIAVVAIFATTLVVYRSLGLSVLIMIPNLLPIVVIVGVMALLGVPLDAGTVVVGCLALGVAVDDSFHLVDRYRYAVGSAPEERIGYAITHTLLAVSASTLVVSAGFFVLGVSDFTLTRNLGVLTASAMIVCLIADLTLLPALLRRWGPGPVAAREPGDVGEV